MTTPEEIRKYGEIDPELAQFLSTLTLPPAPTDITGMRKLMADRETAMVESLGPAPASIRETYTTLPLPSGYACSAKVTAPTSPPPSGSPLVILFFGGGFTVGSPEQTTSMARALAANLSATVVAPNYRLAPEHPFPTATHDAYDAVEYIATHATLPPFSANPARGLIVGGASAGANLAAVVCQTALERNLQPPITAQYLNIPMILDPAIVPAAHKAHFLSRSQCHEAPLFNLAQLDAVFSRWQPDVHSPLFSPLNSPSFSTKGASKSLPRTYFQVCGLDPLRDDALIYERVLRDTGVPTKLDVYAGMPHGFQLFLPMHSKAKAAAEDMGKGFAWMLGYEGVAN